MVHRFSFPLHTLDWRKFICSEPMKAFEKFIRMASSWKSLRLCERIFYNKGFVWFLLLLSL